MQEAIQVRSAEVILEDVEAQEGRMERRMGQLANGP